jgi:biopolymer transport protein ExbD
VSALGLLLLAAGPIAATDAAQPQPIAIEVLAGSPQQCTFKIDGRTVSPSVLKQMLEAEPDKTRNIHLSAAKDTPWRCVAGAVFEAQSAGFETVGFISEPESE